MTKRRAITANELLQQLQADPGYVARQAAKKAWFADLSKQLAAEEAPLLAALERVGVAAESVYDFVGQRLAPPAAYPVLVAHLAVRHHPRIREGIVRALGVPTARGLALEPLRSAYLAEQDAGMRWVIANALAGMARLDEVADLPGIDEYAALFV